MASILIKFSTSSCASIWITGPRIIEAGSWRIGWSTLCEISSDLGVLESILYRPIEEKGLHVWIRCCDISLL